MRIRIVDAFTDRPFSGNPAGVLLLDAFPDDDWLRNVAKEVNHAETAFAHPLPPGGEADWALRWFTPVAEVAMCGHATLATAHVLNSTGTHEGPVRFATRSGVLVATPRPDGSLTLDFPTAPLTPVPVPDGVTEALGAEPVGAFDTGPQVGDLLLELADEKTVLGLAPDLRSLGRFSERGIIATARAEDPAAGHDYVSRCFFPNIGIDEDPVTGSAHTALAPFWSERLGRPDLTGLQASARSGHVRTGLRGGRTLLSGRAVTVIDGELLA
ncbi:PhzF family phenazine biosynthesis protein [Streptomyces caniscabiei]|uniref:PhzF family phenazine biosynthesis protein n=1 Tax=Streptomyces caniscabiei TaxID=2746961 RepID=A0A927L4R3_9ACTN|nr:PhzF family phenazine biosynthesis protein [Streptomyces caniscabiei]MBD9726046.1 PhzF family phenazine biosynthesis protein [Streptomyces caniscabiei]MDX3515698.1 PhzF family phenazine biosynthesis protein [Streptomyces caniscabiei]MDX3724917.1 PhzF family phenazine biosynthesis protein [Streptomyces caniscabiei]MDX3733789.1 PhzF family phenazine biosynthesis protein [Streptomyces caniscabiei]WEO28447.1 PhzF family phenazine biosynthesis protein [Streptomyces caniscabiei]